MEEIIKCPFCGEEIFAEAKKCKHCGEWLDKDHPREVELDEDPDSEEGGIWKRILTALEIAFIIAIFIFTVPKEQKHLSKAYAYADKYSTLLIQNLKGIAAENINSSLLSVSDIIDEDDCSLLRKKVKEDVKHNFVYKNCLFFSTGDINGDTSQIGVLGFVLDFTSLDEEIVERDASKIWNEIVDYIQKATASELLGLSDLEDALDFFSLFSNDSDGDNDASLLEQSDTEQITLKGSISESSTGVTMTLSISDDDSVSGYVTFTFEGYEDTPEQVVTAKVKGYIHDTSEPGWAKMELIDEDGENYVFDPFPRDFDDEIAVWYGNGDDPEIIYMKKE